MLILILIYVQYSQKAVFTFEKGVNCQNDSSGSHHLVKKSPPAEFPIPPIKGENLSPPHPTHPLLLFGKTQRVRISTNLVYVIKVLKSGK